MTALSIARRGKRSAGWFLAGGLLFFSFVALGTWQLERRAWKLDLIARVDRRIHAAAVPAPGPDRWPRISAAEDEYRHVYATGVFLDGQETLVQAVTELGPGFWLMTPLRLADGSVILVNRGFVAVRRSTTSAVPGEAPQVTVEGLLRLTEPGGGFLRRNDAAAGRWYSRDVAAIAATDGLGRAAPYFIDAAAAPRPLRREDEPVGGLTVVAFHNSHLVYAITWYTLALGVVMAGWLVARDGAADAAGSKSDKHRRGRE